MHRGAWLSVNSDLDLETISRNWPVPIRGAQISKKVHDK